MANKDTSATIAPVTFSLGGKRDDGEYVLYPGKLFEVGNFPDKNFSLSDDEADDAVAHFTPVPVNLEHVDTILSNEKKNLLGEVVEFSKDGSDLVGTVKIPKWLDGLIGTDPVKVSAEWSVQSPKRLVGLALCLNPRIDDAMIKAAFTKAGSDDSRNGSSKMSKRTLFQRAKALFTGLSDDDAKTLDELTDEQLKSLKPDGEPNPKAEPDADQAAEIERLKALLAERESSQKAAEGRSLESEAEKFAMQVIKDGKAFPNEKDAIVAAFTVLAKNTSGVAMFSDSGELNASAGLKAFQATYEARPKLTLTGEVLKDQTGYVVFDKGDKPADKEARTEELLSMTPAGRKILADKKKEKSK